MASSAYMLRIIRIIINITRNSSLELQVTASQMFFKDIFVLLIALLVLLAPTALAGPAAGAACYTALGIACAGLGPGWFACYMAGINACNAALVAPTP